MPLTLVSVMSCAVLQMLKNASFPGSNNGTGLFQTIVGLKVREVYERITQKVRRGRGAGGRGRQGAGGCRQGVASGVCMSDVAGGGIEALVVMRAAIGAAGEVPPPLLSCTWACTHTHPPLYFAHTRWLLWLL